MPVSLADRLSRVALWVSARHVPPSKLPVSLARAGEWHDAVLSRSGPLGQTLSRDGLRVSCSPVGAFTL